MQRDLMVEPNHQKGNWFEEERAAKNLGLGNTAPGWYTKIHCKKLSYTAVKPFKDNRTDRLYVRKA